MIAPTSQQVDKVDGTAVLTGLIHLSGLTPDVMSRGKPVEKSDGTEILTGPITGLDILSYRTNDREEWNPVRSAIRELMCLGLANLC